MAGLIPDGYIPEQQIITPPYVETNQEGNSSWLSEYLRNKSLAICELVLGKNKCVIRVLTQGDSGQETRNLSSEIFVELTREQLIGKLKQLPDYEGSKVKEVVEKGNLEIKRINGFTYNLGDTKIIIPTVYALYNREDGNLFYFTDLEGREYFNLDIVRKDDLRGGLKEGYSLIAGATQIVEKGVYNLYIGNRKVDIKSDEYSQIILCSIGMMKYLGNSLVTHFHISDDELK